VEGWIRSIRCSIDGSEQCDTVPHTSSTTKDVWHKLVCQHIVGLQPVGIWALACRYGTYCMLCGIVLVHDAGTLFMHSFASAARCFSRFSETAYDRSSSPVSPWDPCILLVLLNVTLIIGAVVQTRDQTV
jgi:hypothetical protein